jgi:hypothetical protein
MCNLSPFTFQFAMANEHHPLNMWLAEELAHLYLALEAARLNERNSRERHEAIGTAYEEERNNHRETNETLAECFAENTVLRLENARLRTDLDIATNVIAQNRDIIRAYRMSAVPLVRPRNLPDTFVPTLRRIRDEQEERRRVRANNGQIDFL